MIDGSELQFFDNDEEGAKQKGVINIHKATDISDETEKSNGIDIVMSSTKSYHLFADNEDEAADWFRFIFLNVSCMSAYHLFLNILWQDYVVVEYLASVGLNSDRVTPVWKRVSSWLDWLPAPSPSRLGIGRE